MSQETIRQAWREAVWAHAEIQAFSGAVLEHDITEETHKEIARCRWLQKVNFFGFRVRRRVETLINRGLRYHYLVDCSYTRWADPDGVNYNLVLDGIEKLADIVQSELGSTWNGQVEDYAAQNTVPAIQVSTLGDEKVYRAEYSFEGIIGAISI